MDEVEELRLRIRRRLDQPLPEEEFRQVARMVRTMRLDFIHYWEILPLSGDDDPQIPPDPERRR